MATAEKQTETEIIHSWPAQGDWTYDDYARLPNDGWRYEIVEGRLAMSPAPSVAHQATSLALVVHVYNYVQQHGLGRVLEAPIDVVLSDPVAVVQPDIVFIRTANLGIITAANIQGVPDLVIEILAPATARHDRHTKYRLYAEAGVTEYWIIDPDARTADVYARRGNAFVPFGHFAGRGVIQSELLPDLRIPLDEVTGMKDEG